MFSEIIQSQGQTLHDFTHMRCLKQSNSWKQRIEFWFPGAGGGGHEELLFNRYVVSVMQGE